MGCRVVSPEAVGGEPEDVGVGVQQRDVWVRGWESVPLGHRHALQVHVSRLRTRLAGGICVDGDERGYLLRVGPGQLEVDRFEELAGRGRAELGIDPSPRFRELEAMILCQDAALGAAPAGELPVTRFASGPAGRLAYQVLGDAPASIVLIPGFGGNVELRWEEPTLSRFYRRLAGSVRLVLMDKRGTGLSDRDTGMPPVAEQVDDVLAVMDAAGVERAMLFGVLDGGAIALLTAATHPERVTAVVTYACFPSFDDLAAYVTGFVPGR